MSSSRPPSPRRRPSAWPCIDRSATGSPPRAGRTRSRSSSRSAATSPRRRGRRRRRRPEAARDGAGAHGKPPVRAVAVPEPRPRRGTAVALTILALALSLGAYVLAGLGRRGRVPVTFLLYGSIFAVGFLVAHLAIRRFAPRADPALFPIAGVLTGIGFAMIFRLDGSLAAEQATWIVVGLVLFVVTLVVIRDHRQLDAYTYTIGLAGLVVPLPPIVPGLGATINGARLWVSVGPFTVQPSELGKVLVVVFLASYLNAKRELLSIGTAGVGPFRLPPLKHLAPLVVAWATSLVVLFVEKDLGASLLYFAIFVVMLWVATGRSAYLVIGLVLFAAGAAMGYAAFAHVQDRVAIWL